MKKAAVIGNPISHSKSPRLHNHWLNILGIDGTYTRILAPLDGFEKTVKNIKNEGYLGTNVTIPFKSQAAELSDQKSNFVQKTHAANTLVFGDKIESHNTDGYGFAQNIWAKYPEWNPKGDHVILGAGGAATAIVAWLANQGANSITIINRNLERAEALKKLGHNIKIAGWDELPKLLPDKTTLVNTTSRGMNGENDIELSFENASRDMIVNDIVYTPLETKILRDAKSSNLRIVDGLGMLLWQARPGFCAWFGEEAPKIDQGLRNFMLSKKIVALTGSMGMGKSTVANMFQDEGFEIWEADEEVAKLYEGDEELYEFIGSHCPKALADGFDKSIWRDYVFNHKDIFPRLEALIHQKIAASRRSFLESEAEYKLCDIPLLFENNLEALYDQVIVVTANENIQKDRVLARGTMSDAQFEDIKSKQMPDEEKRARADVVIRTDVPLTQTRASVHELAMKWKNDA